jgi:hypothetical protein
MPTEVYMDKVKMCSGRTTGTQCHEKNMVISPAGRRTKYHYAGEGQQQLSRNPTAKAHENGP